MFIKSAIMIKSCRFISLLIGESTARLGRKFKLDES